MARPAANFPPAEQIWPLVDDRGLLSVRATPGARDEAIAVTEAAGRPVVAVRVTAPPDKGKANEAIIVLLAKALDVPRSAITLAHGETARDKRFLIRR